jgi:cytochrome P450 / NADPH-cytochrome P450 reductase
VATAPPLDPIPHPPGHLLVGNLFDIDAADPLESLAELARKYGPIYRIELPGRGSRVIVSSYELVDELCDESRFDKMLGPGLKVLGEGPVGRGLCTSETADPNWRKAHNVLLPAFSMDAMRSYYSGMLDLAVQLVRKWERLNPDDTVDVPTDMTRLTLDDPLCGFNYRLTVPVAPDGRRSWMMPCTVRTMSSWWAPAANRSKYDEPAPHCHSIDSPVGCGARGAAFDADPQGAHS